MLEPFVKVGSTMKRSWEWGHTFSKLNRTGRVKASYSLFLFLLPLLPSIEPTSKERLQQTQPATPRILRFPVRIRGGKKKPSQKHCVSSPGVEHFWQPSAAWLHSHGVIYHFFKKCNTRAGFSSSIQNLLQHRMLFIFFATSYLHF